MRDVEYIPRQLHLIGPMIYTVVHVECIIMLADYEPSHHCTALIILVPLCNPCMTIILGKPLNIYKSLLHTYMYNMHV